MLATVFVLIVTTFLANGFPSADPAYQDTDLQQVVQQSINDDYFQFDPSPPTAFVNQVADFTVTCAERNRICTNKNECLNGYIQINENIAYHLSNKKGECRIQDEVCCTVVDGLETVNSNSGSSQVNLAGNDGSVFLGGNKPSIHYDQNLESTGFGSSNNPTFAKDNFPAPTNVQLGCAAALLCVEERFCTLDGTISPEPVVITEKQLFRRVPLNSCKNPENGIIGKCCRDPNYVDPWPTGNLPANYSGGFDEQGFPTFLNIAKVRPPKVPVQIPVTTPAQQVFIPTSTEETVEPVLIPEHSVPVSEVLVPPKEDTSGEQSDSTSVRLKCGVRNTMLRKSSMEESETAFAEIPWQAMVLNTEQRKILCSGALMDVYNVLTAASCVANLSPEQISIKLGEWKLGHESAVEEPLPFAIHNVSSIYMHPGYTPGLGNHDLAVVHLQTPAAIDLHVNPLCLPEIKYAEQPNRQCIATGWGKSILQAHYAGAIMHAVNMDILSNNQCRNRVIETELEAHISDEVICGITKEQRNNVCEADVGGPLACENEQGLYELAGIYSQDTGCVSTNQVAMFAALDEKWMRNVMCNANANGECEELLTNEYRDSTFDADNQYLPPN